MTKVAVAPCRYQSSCIFVNVFGVPAAACAGNVGASIGL